MLGMAEGSGTRSSLLWEVKRLLQECVDVNDGLPQILLLENVPQIHSKANMPHFQRWLDFLNQLGYTSFWQDLNAKNYGVAQSRNRTFVVSILGDYTYSFPVPVPLNRCMKDYLEEEVDEKYYITSQKAKDLIDKLIIGGKILQTDRQTDRQLIYALNMEKQLTYQTESLADTMLEYANTNMRGQESVNTVGFIEKGTGQHQSNTVYGIDGISPCMNAVNYKEPYKILEVDR